LSTRSRSTSGSSRVGRCRTSSTCSATGGSARVVLRRAWDLDAFVRRGRADDMSRRRLVDALPPGSISAVPEGMRSRRRSRSCSQRPQVISQARSEGAVRTASRAGDSDMVLREAGRNAEGTATLEVKFCTRPVTRLGSQCFLVDGQSGIGRHAVSSARAGRVGHAGQQQEELFPQALKTHVKVLAADTVLLPPATISEPPPPRRRRRAQAQPLHAIRESRDSCPDGVLSAR